MFFRKRPLIGLTKPELKPMNLQFVVLWLAVWLGGGKPFIFSPQRSYPNRKIHGLMLGGGTDVFPGLFFKEPKVDYPYDHRRDELEMQLLEKADEHHLPVFAICRGAQLMNVYNKGTLHLDIANVYKGANYPDTILGYLFFRKPIRIEPGTLLHRIFQTKETQVNSIHRQSVDRVGEGLVVSAREPNGIVQAIEKPGERFYLGVQFHPERLIHRTSFRLFFKEFVGAARAHRQRTESAAKRPNRKTVTERS